MGSAQSGNMKGQQRGRKLAVAKNKVVILHENVYVQRLHL